MDKLIYGLLNGKIGSGIGDAVADYMEEHSEEIFANLPYETWTFTLSDDTTVTKKVVITE